MADSDRLLTPPAAPVSLVKVSKSFGATRALDRVDLSLQAGKVHVLAGQNGAGKSTLIRILSGVYRDYEGEIRVDGVARRLAGPQGAREAGIVTIHQELSLIGSMSVTDNLLLSERGGAWAWLRRDRNERARAMLQRMDLDVDPRLLVESLPLATRQLLEIARALGHDARVLVMDEPTSALSESEAERLFDRIDAMRDDGCAVLYISHRMEEIDRLADRITVLRDGKRIITAETLDRRELVSHMIGHEVARARRGEHSVGEARLAVKQLRAPGLSVDELTIARGEVLGVTGLRGSGASRLSKALFGAIPDVSATVSIDGEILTTASPRHCIESGMILLSGDRNASLVRALSVTHNATLSSLERFSRWMWMRRSEETRCVERTAKRLDIVCPSLDAPAWQLSGGNQQKVALARGLLTEPRVLLLDEPTRGIDVGAKEDVYALVTELAEQDVAILLVSSESEELVRVCDRVAVFHDGRVVAVLEGDDLSRERILAAALGGRAE
jgi:ribose transport system ATP-binding protein